MYSIEKLEKQQIGLKLPKYIIEEIDEFTKKYSVNRTDIITEALRVYISEQKNKFLFEDELLSRVNDIKEKRVEPLSRDEVFDGI